jgi:hypothetical protein
MNNGVVYPPLAEPLIFRRRRLHLRRRLATIFRDRPPCRVGPAQHDASNQSPLDGMATRVTAVHYLLRHLLRREVISFATIAVPGEINLSHRIAESGRSHDHEVIRHNEAGATGGFSEMMSQVFDAARLCPAWTANTNALRGLLRYHRK